MIELESMAVAMPRVEGHPNRADFRGVLTLVDVPSERAPHGSNGHRVVLPRKVAEGALASLIGMALDYAPTFERHDARRKVGVITKAEVVGRNLEVGGYLYAKDFPEIVKEIEKFGGKERVSGFGSGSTDFGSWESEYSIEGPGNAAGEGKRMRESLAEAVAGIRELRRGLRAGGSAETTRVVLRAEAEGARGGPGLGMSYELTDVEVVDRRARMWILTQATFTGAAILRRSKAAYQETWIELAD